MTETNVFHMARHPRLLQQDRHKADISRLRGVKRISQERTAMSSTTVLPVSSGRITRWEHEHILEAVQQRLDGNPQAMRQRRETAEHPFATLKMRMGATHFLMKRLPKVATEMALHVLAYNLTRVMNIIGVQPLLAAMRA